MKFLFGFLVMIASGTYGQSPSHSSFTAFLQKYVTASGAVNYKAMLKDSAVLNRYLKTLSKNPPNKTRWSREEQMAYWINAYNGFTLQLILKYYPIQSIKDIGSTIQIPFINTPWDIKFIRIGNETYDLNNIEHGILRKEFDDPRIHMALVCASKSCPRLLNEAFEPTKLNQQLNDQARAFLTDTFRNNIQADRAQLSMIFKWYGMDFNQKGSSVQSFINRYSVIQLTNKTKITYLDYDWGLNE